MKASLLLFAMTLLAGQALQAKTVNVYSPDKRLTMTVSDDSGRLQYSLALGSQTLIERSTIGINIRGNNNKAKISSVKTKNAKENISAPFYRQASFQEEYNKLTMTISDGIGLEIRMFNEGAAYRFFTKKKGEIIVDGETAQFNFANDGRSWLSYSTNKEKPFAMAFQNIYSDKKLSEQEHAIAFLPIAVDCGEAKVTIAESDLESYPGMFVEPNGKHVTGVFAPYPNKMDYYPWRHMSYVKEAEDYIAKTKGMRTYPWRIIQVSTSDTELPTSNLVYALASPNRIGDTSWIKPGKVAWDWWNDWNLKGVGFKAGINMPTYKYYIDFAAKSGLQYIVLDEGWYDSANGDMAHAIKDIDLPELIRYGKERGIGIVLWTVFNVLDENLEALCKQYADMGVKGFKVDFMDRDDQTAVEMAYRIAEACAKHHLILDYHGFYKPTGFNRTYPNILNVESIFGMEEMRWNADKKDMPMYDVTFPYLRMMCGPVDYTPGAMRNATKDDYVPIYRNPMSMGTRCHQLACYVVHDSPFTMLCDAPTNYKGSEDCVELMASIPEVFDKTICTQGKIGEYIVTARKKGDNWYIGGMTNWDSRDLTIDLSFLDEGATYEATIFTDGINADHNAEDYAVKKAALSANGKQDIHLASGGGFVICAKKKM